VTGRLRSILLKTPNCIHPEFLRGYSAIDNSLDESSGPLVGGSWSRATVDGMPPTSEKERRLCGPGIFRVAPEREFFNRIGRKQTVTLAAIAASPFGSDVAVRTLTVIGSTEPAASHPRRFSAFSTQHVVLRPPFPFDLSPPALLALPTAHLPLLGPRPFT